MKKLFTILLFVILLFGCNGVDDENDGDDGNNNNNIEGDKYLPDGYETLFTHGLMHEVEIVISQSEWDGLIQDMKDYIKTERYREATYKYSGPAGEATIEEVGFRVKGNISRVIPQDDLGNYHRAHFKARFNHEFDMEVGSEEYEKRNDRRFCQLRVLNFRMPSPGPPTWDLSQMRELFSYDVMNRAGSYTSKTGSCRLYITIGGTKHYFGVYTLEEPIDKSFLTKKFGSDKNDGNLYKCIIGDSGPASLEPVDGVDGEGNATIIFPENRIIGIKDWRTKYRPTYDLKTNEEEADHTVLLDFIENLNSLEGADFKAYMDENFEMDRFLRYLAMNFLLGRWDDYTTIGNNFYLYFNNDGKIDFFTTDNDSALAASQLFYSPSVGIYECTQHANELLSFLSGIPVEVFNNARTYDSPLTRKVFEVQEYRDLYEHYLKEFITPANKLFIYSEYEKIYDTLYELYTPYLDNDINEGEEMLAEIRVQSYFYEKTKSIISQLGLNEADYETGPISLKAPTGVSAGDASSSDSITVRWNNVSFADYYRVYRSDSIDGTYVQVKGLTGTIQIVDDTTTPGTTYYYKVKAFTNDGVESDFSAADEGSTAFAGVAPPAGVTATDGVYNHMVSISWSPELNADYYRVYRSDSAGGTYNQIGGDVAESRANDKTATTGVQYYYKVKAFTGDGDESDYSDADIGFADASGLGPPDIIYGAPLVEGTYSYTDVNTGGVTVYRFFSDGTCSKSTPNPDDLAGPKIETSGEWYYASDGKELNIDTSGLMYNGMVNIRMIEIWENAFTDETGAYLNLLNLKKTPADPEGILGFYEGRGNVRAIVTGPTEVDELTEIGATFEIREDGWEIVFDVNGALTTLTGSIDEAFAEGNILIEYGGDYYIILTDWPLLCTRQ